jgi:hypothetical protein
MGKNDSGFGQNDLYSRILKRLLARRPAGMPPTRACVPAILTYALPSWWNASTTER